MKIAATVAFTLGDLYWRRWTFGGNYCHCRPIYVTTPEALASFAIQEM